VLADDRLPAFIRDHAVERHPLAGWVEPLMPWHLDVALEQFERVHHRPMCAGRGAELEGVQELREHPPVVV
jgi:hypothetical protein